MYTAHERALLAAELAGAMLAGTWSEDGVAESGAGCLARWPSWIDALALRLLTVYRAPPASRGELERVIGAFLAERPAPGPELEPPRIVSMAPHPTAPERKRPALAPGWPLAPIDSVGVLASRLELSDGQLAWLADVRSLERTVSQEKLRNYRYRVVTRRSGLPRVLEAPKARLKEIQRWVLHEILDHVPPHDAAHGFTRGRSVVSHAELHCGQRAVLRLDLADFFASVTAARTYGIFRTVGYAPAVAHALTGLSTNTVPPAVWHEIPRTADASLVQAQFWLGRQLATPHLPQGAPASPALANLAAFRLDRRLTGLAGSVGLRYSRYADDLTFSGSAWLRRREQQFTESVARIAREEGFSLNRRKSRLVTSGGRQSVCGVVVNAHPNLARTEYDRLKAILHNSARLGPASQNRTGVTNFEEHLRGRIAWVASLNPDRGERLRRRFAAIDWNAPGQGGRS
ncbi:MAG TPA: reverse transcriptase family protein [Solirubrobacteraceae bacterium]|nr:reverse transcriptase family protein [Solirubrobacteraceae bacterium]